MARVNGSPRPKAAAASMPIVGGFPLTQLTIIMTECAADAPAGFRKKYPGVSQDETTPRVSSGCCFRACLLVLFPLLLLLLLLLPLPILLLLLCVRNPIQQKYSWTFLGEAKADEESRHKAGKTATPCAPLLQHVDSAVTAAMKQKLPAQGMSCWGALPPSGRTGRRQKENPASLWCGRCYCCCRL